MLAQLKPTNLTEYVGTEFDVLDDPAQACCLTLSSVVEHVKTQRQEVFSLFFQGPSNPYLLQGVHKLKHAQLGEFELFLVPVAQEKDGFQYEAAFNHVIGS
jgi:hypothetical protein